MGIRSFLYQAAARLGDINAARKGKVAQRVVRKTVYRQAHKVANRAFKKLFK